MTPPLVTRDALIRLAEDEALVERVARNARPQLWAIESPSEAVRSAKRSACLAVESGIRALAAALTEDVHG